MKAPVLHTDADGEIILRQLTISEAAEMADLVWQREHAVLLARLDDAQVSPEERLKALTSHDDSRGLASELTRQCFRMTHALEIIRKASDPKDHERLGQLPPDEVVHLGLQVLGYKDRTTGDKDSGKAKAEEKKP